MSNSDDDVPLKSRRPASAAKKGTDGQQTPSRAASPAASVSSSASDAPLASRKKKAPAVNGKSKPAAASNGADKRPQSEVDSDSDSDVPLAKKVKKDVKATAAKAKAAPAAAAKKAASTQPAKRKRATTSKSDDEDAPEKKVKATRAKKETTGAKGAVKKETKAAKAKDKKVKTEDEELQEEEEEHKWWLEMDRDDSIKWQTLSHNGPLFPPLYEPHGVKLLYDGKPVDLDPDSEEVASFFATLVGTDHGNNPTFQKNFFSDFLKVLEKDKNKPPLKKFELCDFSRIAEHLEAEREKRKAMSKEEKLKIKEDKLKLDAEYGFAILDGRKEKIGNYRIEPPSLFRGRGAHPKTGKLKTRVAPEQVTLNIGKEAQVPEPPAGHKWGSVIHDNTVTWLATWKENVNDSTKYIFLAANSSLKGQSDFKKFEKARVLKTKVEAIRRDYERDLKAKEMYTRQLATAMYLIDRLALRAGNAKNDEEEADTVGCCSLRLENISLAPPNKVTFDFLGKDSIRFYKECEVSDQVFKNLKIFKKPPKVDRDDVFDRLNTMKLNKHLNSCMPGLSAKVFRTYNASHTFQEELKKTPKDGTVAEKILAYQRANREVAVLCNHQKAVSKNHSALIQRIIDKVRALKYERMLLRQSMLELDPKLKKKRPELDELESDLDDEFIESHKQALAEKEKDQLAVKLERENTKRAQEGAPLLKELEVKKPAQPSLESLEKKLVKIDERIQAQKMLLIDKDEGKSTALGTSKINYIDPRISAAWCRKYGVPLDKVFAKTLRDKFNWAMDADEEWLWGAQCAGGAGDDNLDLTRDLEPGRYERMFRLAVPAELGFDGSVGGGGDEEEEEEYVLCARLERRPAAWMEDVVSRPMLLGGGASCSHGIYKAVGQDNVGIIVGSQDRAQDMINP
ncbi:DNA topoisomerase 1 [Geranomyces variabilis]|uniref:DNA topoisomerase I n=1 Tax=Geranomyces variabilis TaxID=109894 RepID=A0AAD5TDL3_9FUNG|nr:DNA topoisomerase 1 [Geranomyces variabilis]